ncbi:MULTISPECIES: class I SAM-dependent methyltransferase [Klebsiella]|uniref:class I SAM-dependent methyltransferase n=1 Tax=Klebsiella TaxID=570 RepID=UPI0006E52425|nr:MULTISPECIES: class I SAM-dependent methyltransferase [Klebsiella]EKW0785242.1 methyltransferase domain-containing protein [Klebsiella michiganensis]ELT9687792.1 methyltransferase domain-containing protein [Klebsiella michiganensis]EMB9089450.1 methyltransferase domain-containing protein [Klebsiella michiganensis]EMD5182516.1 methyltransferase domain-containing protein [Klebsiella michiganensis]MBA8302107.1 methyltransferase domain-containing protein [Klebsiella michiganensis]
MNASEKAGHTFLASLGKTRLRPGGIEATEWLFQQAGFTADSKVLEVACNMGTTSIELAQRFRCSVYAIDMDKDSLAKARQNIVREGVDHRVIVMEANAARLPFADATFDMVINEAMLTMYADKAKEKLVAEYFRVLKPGGRLLTHDIMYTQDALGEDARRQLQGVVKSHVSPLSAAAWQTLFQRTGFDAVSIHHGPMSLMSPRGLMKDEGFKQALKIVGNGLLKRENRPRFLSMLRFFQRHKRHLNFIACCSVKATEVKSLK